MATELGHLSESMTYLFKAFEQSDDFVLLLDQQGQILRANKTFLETFSVSSDGLVDLSILHFDPGFPVTEILLHRRIQGVFKTSADESFLVDISVTPHDLDKRPCVLLIARRYSRAVRLMGTIINALPGRFGVIDENMQLIRWSEYRTYEPTRSVSHLPSRDLRELLPAALWQQVVDAVREAFEKGTSSIELIPNDVSAKGALLVFTRVEIDTIPHVAMLTVDISDRLQAEKALRESEARFRSIVEQSDDGIVLIDPNGLIAEWNTGQERITGISRSEVIGKPSWNVRALSTPHEQHTADLTQRYERSIRRALASGHAPWIDETMDWQLELPNGDQCFVETVSFSIHVDQQKMLGSISRDISGSKKHEQTLQEYTDRLKALAARLADAQETERMRCSAELHDQVGQGLTALDLTLTATLRSLSDQEDEAKGLIEQALQLTRRTATSTRNLMADMRPAILDEYGFEAALSWYVERLTSQTEIPVRLQVDVEIPRLSNLAETALFRIAQEAITNALKHSNAEQIRVSLALCADSVELIIQDDGQGFDALRHVSGGERGWGLMIMDERATAVGGNLAVESQPGQGTCVIVQVPQS
jgi:PAS domain S-box-containing protein